MQSFPGMPYDLAAKIDGSSADTLFRLALDYRVTYMTLAESAWKDVRPVVQWFIEQKLYDDGIQWLYDNTPDFFERTIAMNRLFSAKEKESST